MPRKGSAEKTAVLTEPKHGTGAARTGISRARVCPELKAQAEALLAETGLSSSDALRMFYKQVTLRNDLPFEARILNATTRKALRDAEAGRNMTDSTRVDEMFKDPGI